jgi:hypothetical protein
MGGKKQNAVIVIIILGVIVIGARFMIKLQARTAEFEFIDQTHYPFAGKHRGEYVVIIIVKELGTTSEENYWQCEYYFKPLPKDSVLKLKNKDKLSVSYNSWFFKDEEQKKNALFEFLHEMPPSKLYKTESPHLQFIDLRAKMIVSCYHEVTGDY